MYGFLDTGAGLEAAATGSEVIGSDRRIGMLCGSRLVGNIADAITCISEDSGVKLLSV